MDLTKILTSFTAFAQWVKDGLAKKQSKAIVKTVAPTAAEGTDGDICVVVDANA